MAEIKYQGKQESGYTPINVEEDLTELLIGSANCFDASPKIYEGFRRANEKAKQMAQI
ncbi:MAG: hypothetical protein QQN41_11800 [Nitrosopumilus sp.]